MRGQKSSINVTQQLPLFSCIKLKILILVCKAQRSLAMKYLIDGLFQTIVIHFILQADLIFYFLLIREQLDFSSSRLSHWKVPTPSTRSQIFAPSSSSSFAFLKTYFFSNGIAHWFPLLDGLHKCLNTILMIEMLSLPTNWNLTF